MKFLSLVTRFSKIAIVHVYVHNFFDDERETVNVHDPCDHFRNHPWEPCTSYEKLSKDTGTCCRVPCDAAQEVDAARGTSSDRNTADTASAG